MENVEVLLIVRVHEGDDYIEYMTKTPMPWVSLSTAIKRQIKKLVGEK